jgi:anaerobic C4-dicarboxylate transporter DcuA
VIFVFGFGLPPGSPPGIVLGMIIAVITALAAMEASGGLDYLISIATRIMKKKPQYITFVAPLVTYILVFASGTQHVIYALLPVIAEVSRKAGIRPERPLSISVIAAQHGLIASPISAATVALIAALVSYNIRLINILMVIIPSTLLGVIVGILSVAWRGKKLDEDPEYLARLKAGKIKTGQTEQELSGAELRNARNSLLLFLFTILTVVIIGILLRRQ